MRIESAQVDLRSSYQAMSRYTRDEQLDTSLPGKAGQMTDLNYRHQQVTESASLLTYENLRSQAGKASLQDTADKLSEQVAAANRAARQASESSSADSAPIHSPPDMSAPAESKTDEDFFELSADDKLRISLIQSLLSSITGRDIELNIADLRIPKNTDRPTESQPNPAQLNMESSDVQINAETPTAAPQASLEYQVKETFYQQETSQFQAKGQIKTADGQQIQIDLSLHMSRELTQHSDFSLRLGAALKDPLVISFDGNSAELSQQRFEFDLTLDGQKDSIPGLSGHSAFLALDKNADGIINDGNELFGAKTGDGFTELAQYDDDGNGWIDENDFIFEHLRLWLKPGEGQTQQLISLKEGGVGAIYLGNADTPFTLSNSLGSERLGVIRSSGIFVSDQGQAGIIQHVDLSI